jgi:hypothetical protein
MRTRALVLPAFLLVGALLATPATRWSAADEPPGAPKPAFDAKRTAAERAANEETYRELMSWRERLLHEHLGRWVVIAGGKALPVNEHGTMVAPTPSLDVALAAAASAFPAAQHRFVFRLGEDGDVSTSLGGTEHAHVFGTAFLALLDGEFSIHPNGRVELTRPGAGPVTISAKGPDGRPYVKPEIGPPGGAGGVGPLFVLATGSTGFATVPADTAERAGLHLWEIPGVNHVEGVMQSGDCRRARMRVRLPAASLDALIPVAIWPAR